MFEFFVIFSTYKNFLQNVVLSYIAAHYCLSLDITLCDIMWCDNLPHNRGRLLQVTSPYKLFINNQCYV